MSDIRVEGAQRQWREGGSRFTEPVLRLTQNDTKTDFIFRGADFGTPVSLGAGVFAMIEQHIVWSSVSKSTKVERYVIQLQVGSQPPYTLQAFRLFKPIPPEEGSTTASDARSRGKSRTPPLRPGRWIWEEGGPSVKYQNETKADPPRACQRFWERGPTEDCVVLGGVKPKPVTSKPEFKGQRHRKERDGGRREERSRSSSSRHKSERSVDRPSR